MSTRNSPILLALGGLVALAAAMGLGRFLYTPVLPMMLEAGLGPRAAGLVASANFAGYLAGALIASLPVFGTRPRSWLLTALATSALSTAAMAWTTEAWLWAFLRFAGGLASAFVLVMASTIVIRGLQALNAGGYSALHFAGVGAGIVVSALLASPWAVPDGAWRTVWLAGGAVCLLALGVVMVLISKTSAEPPIGVQTAGARKGLWRLIAAYGCLGFGYVITATFLVAILREGSGGRPSETFVWLFVGAAAIPSVAFWLWLSRRWGAIVAYQCAMLIEAAGVAISAIASGTLALSIAAIALGGTFMGLTALGLQEAARRAGGDGRSVMALMTAAFGVGQMLGPSIAGWLRVETGSYAVPSLIAAAVLVTGAWVLWPLRSRPES